MKGLLPKLTVALEDFKERAVALTVPRFEHPVPPMPTDVITQEWFWPRVAGIFRPHDVIVAETGTSYFGLIDVPVRIWSILWQKTPRLTELPAPGRRDLRGADALGQHRLCRWRYARCGDCRARPEARPHFPLYRGWQHVR
jgi:hypothetical protein